MIDKEPTVDQQLLNKADCLMRDACVVSRRRALKQVELYALAICICTRACYHKAYDLIKCELNGFVHGGIVAPHAPN